MKTEQKEYPNQAFSVEPTKLTKLLKMIHDKLDGGATTQDRFFVHMKGDRKVELHNIDDVLELDNSRTKKIERLIIRSFRAQENTAEQTREIEVDFGAPLKKDGSTRKGVTIEVRGDTSSWVSDALADIEQQVERTWTRRGPPVIIAASIVVICLLSLLVAASPVGTPVASTGILASTMWLTPSEIKVYASKLNKEPLSEYDANNLISQQLKNLSITLEQEEKEKSSPTLVPVLIELVLLVVIALGFFIIVVCYPSAVFLWGDEKDRQLWRDNAKRYLWPLLLGITLVPILSRLFLTGILHAVVN